jgi:hypothetical protein
MALIWGFGSSRSLMAGRIGHGARRDNRYPLECPVLVSWQLGGETRATRAICLDVSASGARIECNQPLVARSNLYLQAPTYGLMGNATVRYCRRHGLKYHIGLEFTWAAALAEEGRKQALRKNES